MNNSKLKTILIPIVTAVVGLLVGYVLFSEDSKAIEEVENHNHSQGEEIWTCSMHPQIRQNEPGDCPICGMELIPATENGKDDKLVLEMTEEAMQLSAIQTTVIGAEATGEKGVIKLSGKIQENEENAASLVSHISGRIEKLYVTYTGEQVNKGQKIAEIYSPEWVNAQRELLEAQQLESTNPALLESAKNKLRNWKITEEQIDAILNEKKIQENLVIYAKHNGVITDKRVSVGDYLKAGEVLFDIQNLNSLWVIFDAYESDLSAINIGDEVAFTTTAFPAETFRAKIAFIDPIINPNTRTVSVRAEINNRNKKLKPEMFVQGEIKVSSPPDELKSDLVLVPKTAILWTGVRSVVYLKVPNTEIPSFKYREVRIGETIGDQYVILEGLKTGDEVVTNGAFVIDAAAQLNNQASMMNQHIADTDERNFTTDEVENEEVTFQVSSKFKVQLKQVIRAYLDVKDALVASDPNLTKGNSEKLLKSVSNVDMTLVKGDAHLFWMNQSKKIKATKEAIMSADLKQQRVAFQEISLAIEQLIKTYQISDKVYYLQKCPMANDGKGATWMSTTETIKNPYFGEQMLGCGSTLETIGK